VLFAFSAPDKLGGNQSVAQHLKSALVFQTLLLSFSVFELHITITQLFPFHVPGDFQGKHGAELLEQVDQLFNIHVFGDVFNEQVG
jgi:hypothetical protein